MSNTIEIRIVGDARGLKSAAAESQNTINDLKNAVADKTSQMTGVSRELVSTVTDLAPRFLLVGGAAAVMAKAYADGVAEVNEMNLAIRTGGEISGQTASSMRELSADIASHSRLTITESKSIASAMASSGKIGAGAFEQIGRMAGDFARVMGTDVARVGPELVKLFDDPAKGAEELNRQMHFLSAAELDHIEHLTRMGEVTQAQIELAGKLSDRIGEIEPKLGIVERAWDGVKGAASKAWDAMMGLGREQTTKDRLDAVMERIRLVEAMGSTARNLPTDEQRPALMRWALRLQDQLEAEAQKSFDKSQAAERNRQQQSARSIINRNSANAQAKVIDDEIALIRKAGDGTVEAEQAIAKLQEKRDKLFAEKKTAKKRDVFADTLAENSGINRNFTEQLGALKGGLDAGRISEEAYVVSVETLISRQPFATKALQETIKELANKERVLNKVEAAEAAAADVVEKARESNAQRVDALRLEADMMGKNAAERARLAETRKIDLQLARDIEKVTEKLGKIGDTDGIDAAVQKLTEGAGKTKAAWVDAYGAIETRQRDWIAGAKDGLQSYADEASKTASNVANAFKQGAKMAEDALANFVATGKLDISSLAKFAATELARENLAKPIVSAGSSWLMGLLGGGSAPAASQGFGMAGYAGTLLGFASGGDHAGGWRIVGERGPELEATGPSRIFNANQTREILSGGSGGNSSPQSIRVEVVSPPGRPVEVERASPSFDAEGMVLSIILRDITGNGRVATVLQRQYGLNRAAGTL